MEMSFPGEDQKSDEWRIYVRRWKSKVYEYKKTYKITDKNG